MRVRVPPPAFSRAGPVEIGVQRLAEVLVEGENFYPRMLEDIASASSSVHINQVGFRPGVFGDRLSGDLAAPVKPGNNTG